MDEVMDWRRAAARELCLILGGTLNEGYTEPADLTAKLLDLVVWLNNEFSSPPPLAIEQLEFITYHIQANGTCSYCGHPAELVVLPDQEVVISDRCQFCDAYNLEQNYGCN